MMESEGLEPPLYYGFSIALSQVSYDSDGSVVGNQTPLVRVTVEYIINMLRPNIRGKIRTFASRFLLFIQSLVSLTAKRHGCK